MARKSSGSKPALQAGGATCKRAASQALPPPAAPQRLGPTGLQLRNEISFDEIDDNYDDEHYTVCIGQVIVQTG